jgi:hypothetical protein
VWILPVSQIATRFHARIEICSAKFCQSADAAKLWRKKTIETAICWTGFVYSCHILSSCHIICRAWPLRPWRALSMGNTWTCLSVGPLTATNTRSHSLHSSDGMQNIAILGSLNNIEWRMKSWPPRTTTPYSWALLQIPSSLSNAAWGAQLSHLDRLGASTCGLHWSFPLGSSAPTPWDTQKAAATCDE